MNPHLLCHSQSLNCGNTSVYKFPAIAIYNFVFCISDRWNKSISITYEKFIALGIKLIWWYKIREVSNPTIKVPT